jgi:hypothetical protein
MIDLSIITATLARDRVEGQFATAVPRRRLVRLARRAA